MKNKKTCKKNYKLYPAIYLPTIVFIVGMLISIRSQGQITLNGPSIPELITGDCSSIPPLESLGAFSISGCATGGEIIIDENFLSYNCLFDFTLERLYIGISDCDPNDRDTIRQVVTIEDNGGPQFVGALSFSERTIQCTDPIPPADQFTLIDECQQDITKRINFDTFEYAVILDVNAAMNGYTSGNNGFGFAVDNALVTDFLRVVDDNNGGALVSPNSDILNFFSGITFSITTEAIPLSADSRVEIDNGFKGVGFQQEDATVTIEFSEDVTFSMNGNPAQEAGSTHEFFGDGTIFRPYTDIGSFDDPDLVANITGPIYSLSNPTNVDIVGSTRKLYGGNGRSFSSRTNGFGRMFEIFLFTPREDQVVVTENTTSFTDNCNYTIERTYTAIDCCNNSTVLTQSIIVRSTISLPTMNNQKLFLLVLLVVIIGGFILSRV